MTFRTKLFATTLLLGCGAAFSAGTTYYNMVSVMGTVSEVDSSCTTAPMIGMMGSPMGGCYNTRTTYTIYLSQDAIPCTNATWSAKIGTGVSATNIKVDGLKTFCLDSRESTPSNLKEMVQENWLDKDLAENLNLVTDIDLGEISSVDGECVVNHEPLPYFTGKVFEGNSHKISNLCYVSDSMTEPVGFFGSVKSGNIQNVNFDGVRIIVTDGPEDGSKYYPAGSFAGVVDSISLTSVKLSNVSIEAPFAGGVVGLIKNSTLTKVTTGNNVSISNSQKITTGYAGSELIALNTPYKVFLGGIAGVATRSNGTAHYTLDDDKISVTVQDKATGHRSALGGAVGVVFSSLDAYRSLKVVAGGTVKDPVASKISGGSAMGGLFGYVSLLYQNNSPVANDTAIVKLQNSEFTGTITGASSPDDIAVGGLVGRDSLVSLTRFEITGSTANISFADELSVPGSYRYYAGGILGYGNKCLSSNRESDYVSISSSVSTGTMDLNASDLAVDGLRMKTFMGGMVGTACIAMEEGGFKNNTSSMEITSSVRVATDSISVGGLIGGMDVSGTSGTTLSNLNYTGKIVVNDSLGEVNVGGIVGIFVGMAGGRTLSFKDNYVTAGASGKIVDYRSLAKTKGTMKKGTNIGGLCGYCREVKLIDKVGVEGSIAVDGTSGYMGDSLLVGGLVASIENTNASLTIQNTYSIGDIAVDGSASVSRVGYLMGMGHIVSSYTIRSNYHYSENETVDALGYFSEKDVYGEGIASTWLTNANMTYNIRNGSENTYNDNERKNGTELASAMKTQTFAALINKFMYDVNEEYVWCWTDGKHSSLPYVSVTPFSAIPPSNLTTHVVTFYDYDKKSVLKGPTSVVEHSAAVPPEDPSRVGYEFIGWDTDFSDVTSPLTVVAKYERLRFPVTFCSLTQCPFSGDDADVLTVYYGDTVDAPDMDVYGEFFAVKGMELTGWSDSTFMTGVLDTLFIRPKYTPSVYKIIFLDEAGTAVDSRSLSYGETIENLGTAQVDENAIYAYEFDGWVMFDGSDIPETMPAEDIVIKPVFKEVTKLYKVVFLDYDETPIDTLEAAYNERVDLLAYEEKNDGVFVDWDRLEGSIVVVRDTVLKARVKFNVTFKMTEDSVYFENGFFYGDDVSAVIQKDLNRGNENGYQFKFLNWDKEVTKVYGTAVYTAVYDSVYVGEPESSSSFFVADNMIDGVTLDTAGNAVRLTLATKDVDPGLKTGVRVVVTDENGYRLEETLTDSLTAKSETFTWEKHPLPMGELSVMVEVYNDSTSDSSVSTVQIASTIDVKPWSWRMVSLSKVQQDNVAWGGDASFFWWDEENPIGDYWQYRAFDGGDADPLRGYWYGSIEGKSLTLDAPSIAEDSVIEWHLDSLFSGWNMVANPYGWYVELDSVAAAAEGIHFWRWVESESQYVPTTVAGPYESVWAQTEKNTTWTVSVVPTFKKYDETPATGARKVAALRKNAARKATASNWSVVAVLKGENGKEDSWNVLGAGSQEESLGKAPMGMGKFVRLSIMEGETKLAKSVKAAADEYEWTLKLSASENSDGELTFDGVEALSQLGLTMFVTVDGKTQEVKNSESVKVALAKSAKVVTVRVVPAAKEIASRMNGFKAYQTVKGLSVGFNAPESLAGSTASYALVDVKGKVISSGSFKATEGSNTLNMSTPKPGMYFVQLKLGSQKASAKVFVK